MKIGISLACFYPEHPEDVIKKVCDAGFDIAELFINTESELSLDYIKLIYKNCQKHGLEIYSVHPFTAAIENYMFFSPYDRRIEDAKKFYSRYCDAAKYLGAKVINLHGDRGVGLKNIDFYIDCLKPFAEISDNTGVTFCHENVFFNSINHPQFVKNLNKKLGDNIKYTFDIKQANKGGSDPYELCEAMQGNVMNFHINDYDDDNICLLPGNGVVDHKQIISTLINNGYKGPALIEVYRHNFNDMQDVLQSVEYLKNIKAPN